jgi:penicillin amidase
LKENRYLSAIDPLHKYHFMKILKRIIVGLLVLLVLLAAWGYFHLRGQVPELSRQLRMPGLKGPVEVLYDDHAIPHIYASNEEDLFAAFGYVHAQDRLFQMEVLRRLADGRLSEVFGEKALESDRFFRMLSFREHAKSTLATAYKDENSGFVKAAKAYVKGVNEYIHHGPTPVEFTLAGIPKTDFTLEDMEIITGYMGYTFVGAFRTEAIATRIATELGAGYLDDVMRNWPDSTFRIPVDAKGYKSFASASRTLSDMADRLEVMGRELPFPPFTGSNGWVISGKKTLSGKPILSNDTHIAYSQPSVWYEAHLECPGFSIYGNFLAGTPVPALGHSERGGWGLTMFENDDVDFFREKVNPADPGQVWYKDHWEDLQVRKETIRVKGKPDVMMDVRKSRHGYIMNGAFAGIKDMADPIAVWWVYHQFPSRHLQVFYDISHASVAAEAAKAIEPLTSPGLNFMWADTAGNIAWWAAGKLPVRPKHVNPNLILDGSTGNDDPVGWLDFSQNPQILNPASGVLYTANNQPDDMGTGLVAGYYVPSGRARRIEELIFNDRSDWTEADVRKVINDIICPTYPELLGRILPVIDRSKLTPEATRAMELLKGWDGRHALDDIGPTIYYKFLFEVYRSMMQDELGPETFRAFEHSMALKRNTASLLQKESSPWWDNRKTPTVESRQEILTGALNTAVVSLRAQLGNDMNGWTWKKVHFIEHKHPLGVLPVIGKWFNVGPFPVEGGQETINNLDFSLDSTGIYKVISGPALRRITDFGDDARKFSVNPTGQSGYFMSPFYKDQAQMFVEGGKRPELLRRKDIEKVMIGKTVFRP